jgi:hypothetical protein
MHMLVSTNAFLFPAPSAVRLFVLLFARAIPRMSIVRERQICSIQPSLAAAILRARTFDFNRRRYSFGL